VYFGEIETTALHDERDRAALPKFTDRVLQIPSGTLGSDSRGAALDIVALRCR